MTLFHRYRSVLRWIVARDRAEQELDLELQDFVERAAADKIRAGIPAPEARRLARLELGGVEQAKERVRTDRHGGTLDEILRDVRYACRMFRRNPAFTATVVLTLALGIGANTAIFGLIDALMLRWLPVRHAADLLLVGMRSPGAAGPAASSFSYRMVGALDAEREIFAGVTGFSGRTFDVAANGSVTRVPGAIVTGAFYETLGLNPQAGRLIGPQDDREGAPLVAVLSDGYWQRQFNRSPAAVGEVLRVGEAPVTIVGVSPAGFVGANVGAIADITIAAAAIPRVDPAASSLLGPGNFWLRVIARPKAGASASETGARINASWPRIADQTVAPHWPAWQRNDIISTSLELSPGGTGWTYLRDIYRKPLYVLMVLVGLVLLIACANVASLLLARASARQREIAVRLAIGAGRARILRQLLIESTLLSLCGAALGVGLAWMSGQFLISLISQGPIRVSFDLTPNWHVLAFTSVVAIATALLFGAAPAFHASGEQPAGVLKDDARTGTSRSRLLPVLVAGQVALSLILLAGAGLFVRTFRNLQRLDPGFRSEGVLMVDLPARRSVPLDTMVERAAGIPGITSASVATHTPLSGSSWSEPAVPAGQPVPERDNALFVAAGPRYLTTMGIALVRGRDFRDGDRTGAPAVAIVNEAYARRHFGSRDPIGQQLVASIRRKSVDLAIVGVAADTNTAGLRNAPPATVYVSYAQFGGDFPTTLSVRAAGALGQVSATLQQTLQAALPDTPIQVVALSQQVEATIVQERMMATLAAAFGGLALTLACVGLYGLLAYTVSQRTREIGIRMALGAPRARVLSLILQGGNRLVLAGVAVGLPVAWLASRSIESLLFGLQPADPTTIVGSIVVLAVAAQVAAYLPARRASRVDPLVALRHD